MGRNLYKLTKNFDDVIKMRHLKTRKFSKLLAEYLRNGSTDIHQTYVSLRQSYNKVFKIKILEISHS